MKKSNALIYLVIGIFIVVLIGVSVAKGEKEVNNNHNQATNAGSATNSTNETVAQSTSITQQELNRIIKDELYILSGKTRLDELTNREKLWLCYQKAVNNYDESFSAKKITDYFAKTSISDLGIELKDIGYFATTDNIVFKYNKDDNTYTPNPDFEAKAYIEVEPAYTFIGEYTEEEGKYTVPVRYLWYYAEPGYAWNLYGRYKDALNQTNSLTEEPVELANLTDEEKAAYITNNDVEEYNYVFEKAGGKIKLVDFYVTTH